MGHICFIGFVTVSIIDLSVCVSAATSAWRQLAVVRCGGHR